jgi:hypothetical protein
MPVSSIGTYDPWLNYNDDGKIDLKDVYAMHQAYGAAGTPINKTQMLLDLQNRLEALEWRQDYIKTEDYVSQTKPCITALTTTTQQFSNGLQEMRQTTLSLLYIVISSTVSNIKCQTLRVCIGVYV